MLKAYVNREGALRDVAQSTSKIDVPISAVTALYCPEEDGLKMRDASCARLDNSKFLVDLKSHLCYLSEACQSDITTLISSLLFFLMCLVKLQCWSMILMWVSAPLSSKIHIG